MKSQNISSKTVDYRIQQALKQLRKELKDYLPLLLFFLPLIGTRTSYYILVPYHFITDMMIRSVSAGNICLSKSCVNVPNALPRNRIVGSYLSDYVLHTKRSFYKIQNRCDKILPYPSKDIYNLRIQ